MKIFLGIFLLIDFTSVFGQTTLKLYYADTSEVNFAVKNYDLTDTTFTPKYLRSDDTDHTTYSDTNKYLNDTTVTEIFYDSKSNFSLATRVNCMGDSVYTRHFYRNGKLKQLDIERRSGEWLYNESFYRNGQLHSRCNIYATGQSPQLVINYWSNGKKKREFWLYAGIAVKEYKEWYENGNLKVSGIYSLKNIESRKHTSESLEDGKWIYWKENGDQDKICEYKDGIILKK